MGPHHYTPRDPTTTAHEAPSPSHEGIHTASHEGIHTASLEGIHTASLEVPSHEGIHTASLEGIHTAVWRVAVTRGVYAPLPPSTTRLHATVLGAPGCGKTTYCTEVVRRLGGAVRHVSGGDFHRTSTAELGGEGYRDGKGLNSIKCDDRYMYDNHLTRFVFSCHLTALRLLMRPACVRSSLTSRTPSR
jgi:hypothetical protein